jgi:Acetyltransferase (GNAT) family
MKWMAGSQMCGIGTCIIYKDTAWLAQIVVHPKFQGRGLGTRITETLVALARKKGCNSISLIATEQGFPVYKKLGFTTDTEYLFYKNINGIQQPVSEQIVPYHSGMNKAISELDELISGERRGGHYDNLLNKAFVYLNNSEITGYYIPDWGEGYIGATSTEAGTALMNFRFQHQTTASFPADNIAAAAWLHQHDLIAFKRAKRMFLGDRVSWKAESVFQRIGGNLG